MILLKRLELIFPLQRGLLVQFDLDPGLTSRNRYQESSISMDNYYLNSPDNRLIGSMPTIGVCRKIDGQQEIERVALKNIPRPMAKTVADFLLRDIRNTNGIPV